MSKRTIQHPNGTKKDSKHMAEAKKQELVDVKWESTPRWHEITFGPSNKTANEYKFFTDKAETTDKTE